MILPYVLVCVMFFFAFGERWLAIADLCGEIRRHEAELADVQSRKAELEADLDLTKDPAYLTAKMRQLGYIYPGETVYLGAAD